MICPYCGKDMDAVGLGVCNGWRCPGCGHTDVELGSFSLEGHPDVPECTCKGCRDLLERCRG